MRLKGCVGDDGGLDVDKKLAGSLFDFLRKRNDSRAKEGAEDEGDDNDEWHVSKVEVTLACGKESYDR